MAKKTKTGWINSFKEKGYKYIMYFNNEVYATKANMKKDGDFPDNSKWDVYSLEDGESWPSNRLEKKAYFIGDK